MKIKLANIPWSTANLAAAAVLALLFAANTTLRANPLPGAIYTTDVGCNGVDLNIYGSKADVYLNGGPNHAGALPNGSYYVKVTNPSGSLLLGTSIGSGNDTPFVVTGGLANCIQLTAVLIKASDSTPGYDDTDNNGGEYKAWVSTDPTFPDNSSKTDNFKVREGAPPNPPTLCVRKFYDANVNGVKDPSECYINGWPFQVFADNNLYVEAETAWCGQVDEDSYRVVEGDITNWIHTTASELYPVTLPPDQTVEFGNVCLGAGGGLTLGFWSNKNGQNLENASDFTFLTGLCLRNATGGNQDFTGSLAANKTALNNWLLSASATNMAYMLSAQLTAMELNVRHGFVNGTKLVYGGDCVKSYFPGSNGFITINDLMTAAATELCLHGLTPSGNQFRAYQECLKTTLDDANNNKNFVQSQPCSPFTCAQ